MPTSQDPIDPELEEGPDDPESPSPSRTVAGLLPRFRQSPKNTSPPATAPSLESPTLPADGDLAEPSWAAATGRSSPASTEPREPDDVEVVDPKDLQAAIGQVVDISFVLLGQGLGSLEKRAKDLPEVDDRWLPTDEERRFVLEPAGRIAKRHIKASAAVGDTIDGCLIGAGVGGFALRAYFDVDAIPKQETEK